MFLLIHIVQMNQSQTANKIPLKHEISSSKTVKITGYYSTL